MPTETIDIADQEKIQKETMHEPRGPHVKRDRAKKMQRMWHENLSKGRYMCFM